MIEINAKIEGFYSRFKPCYSPDSARLGGFYSRYFTSLVITNFTKFKVKYSTEGCANRIYVLRQ